MMIRDDHVDSQLSRAPDHFAGPNTRIHADDERHTFRARTLDNLGAHAVAFLEPVRHMKQSNTARQLDRLLQRYHRRGSVHVIVAVDKNFFPGNHGAPYPLDSLRHSTHEEWIVQIFDRRLKEASCGGWVSKAPAV